MAKLDASWVVSAGEYERVRRSYREVVSLARTQRRLRLGSAGTLQFETREFALWHVQELLRVEGWTLPRLRRTVDDVQPWCPRPGEIVGTFMVDTEDGDLARAVSYALSVPGGIVLRAGSVALPSETVEAGFPGDPVWYLRWRTDPGWHAALRSGCTCATAWDQALYTLPAATRAALGTDLIEEAGPGQPLLHRLLESTQRNVQSQRSGREACP